MAIIKSAVWSEVRGSVGGTTYARNKTGQYARNRSKPVNPNTENQSRVRSQFQTNAYGYSLLDVDQVLAWNQFAQGYPAVNRVGDTYTPSGKQMYIMCNQNLASIGVAPIAAPPYDTPIVPSINMSLATLTITVDPATGILDTFLVEHVTSALATAKVIVQTTPNMQPARQSYRNRMRQLNFATQAVAQELSAKFNSYFGTPTVNVGQIVNARFAAVDPATGVSSAWVYLQGVVIATP